MCMNSLDKSQANRQDQTIKIKQHGQIKMFQNQYWTMYHVHLGCDCDYRCHYKT
jgi:hypothetical protein